MCVYEVGSCDDESFHCDDEGGNLNKTSIGRILFDFSRFHIFNHVL